MEVSYLVGVIGLVGFLFGLVCALKLRQWEKQLAGARIAIAYKGKVKMDPRLIDWLTWANMLSEDKRSTGQVVYKMSATTVAILKPRPKHGKAKTRKIKDKRAAPTQETGATPVTRNK